MSVGQVFPEQYQTQLRDKVDQVTAQFEAAGMPLPTPTVFESSVSHYRMRAEFRVWHDMDDSYYIMFNPATKERIRIDSFPVGSALINRLMTDIRTAFMADPLLRRKLYQVEFLTTTKGQALVSMIYHRPLEDDWIEKAKALETQLGIHLIGRSRKQKIVLSKNWIEEQFQLEDGLYQYHQYENTFTQPNAGVATQMLQWAVNQSKTLNDAPTGDLLELYCGIGNFTLPLSRQFAAVTATEMSKLSIKAATENAALNAIDNIEFMKASSEDFSAKWLKSDRTNSALKTLFVDPPRAGLDPATLDLARHFEHIIYISCNPITLGDNCLALSDQFEIRAFACFDQFPYTNHLECGAILIKKT